MIHLKVDYSSCIDLIIGTFEDIVQCRSSTERTVARLDAEPNVPLEREVNRLPVVVLVLLPSNEAVHQTSTLARIAARAGSGATALLEAVFFIIILVRFTFFLLYYW